MDAISKNLMNRDRERIISQFKNLNHQSTHHPTFFIKHSTEEGVIRNGGRRGTCFAPLALLNAFKKLASHSKKLVFHEIETADEELEKNNFEQSQFEESKKISQHLKNNKNNLTIFLGGGHDHIFCALKSIQEVFPDKKIIVINLDPHLDTRTDEFKNSGTPFRQFDDVANRTHSLIQIGTHSFANVESSLAPLKNIEQKIIQFETIAPHFYHPKELKMFWRQYISETMDHNKNDCIYFLSIDVDVIASSEMEAVSAVNHQGIPVHVIESCLDYFRCELGTHFFGFYEYNPLYENLSQKGARTLAALIYRLTTFDFNEVDVSKEL